jgi:hypothetical protein
MVVATSDVIVVVIIDASMSGDETNSLRLYQARARRYKQWEFLMDPFLLFTVQYFVALPFTNGPFESKTFRKGVPEMVDRVPDSGPCMPLYFLFLHSFQTQSCRNSLICDFIRSRQDWKLNQVRCVKACQGSRGISYSASGTLCL